MVLIDRWQKDNHWLPRTRSERIYTDADIRNEQFSIYMALDHHFTVMPFHFKHILCIPHTC